MIYADNAATTKLDPDAFDAMKPFLLELYSNPSQQYGFARKSKKAINEAREIVAACIGAEPEEIIFTSCGTESNNWVIKSEASNEDAIITSVIEHHAILNSCKSLERIGKKILYVPVDKNGVVDLNWLESHITESTKLVSIMFANNEIGTIQPVEQIASIVHRYGGKFHTDAVQAVGHVDIDVHKMGIDLLSASAHKFNGPKGIGFLYKRKDLELSPYIDGGNQEHGYRAGTENVASIVGMATALQRNCIERSKIEKKLAKFENRLLGELKNGGVDFIRNGAKNHVPGNINLSLKNCEGEALLHRLDFMGICVSTGAACDSVNTQLSHVISAINVRQEYAKGTIRISLGKDNTEDEVDKIAASLIKIVRGK